MAAETVIGIDFGTSYTSAGALVGGRVELVQDQGDAAMPSLVYVPRSGDLVVGHRAAARAVSEPDAIIPSIKRLLGVPATTDAIRRLPALMPHPFKVAGNQLVVATPAGDVACEQVAAAIFARVRDLAEQRFGGRVRRAVVAVPATATAGYVQAVRRAAKLAHVEIAQIVAEPIAGALALGLQHQPEKRRLVVCDFGGGTFDVTAIVQDGLRFSPVATCGEEYLGGDDLDAAMAHAVAGAIYRRTRFQVLDDFVRRAQLLQRCESVKRALSTQQEARLTLRDAFIEQGAYRTLDVVIDRAWVAPVWAPIIERAIDCVARALGQAGWSREQVDRVVLIGGSSCVPQFRDALAALVGADRIATTPQAGLAVAIGTTLVTAKLVQPSAAQPSLAGEDDGIPIHLA